MYKCSGDTVYHLLVHCAISPVSSMFVVHWVTSGRVVGVVFGWKNWFAKHGSSFAWNIAPLCLMWAIWSERNNCTFNGVENLAIELKSSFLRSLFEWSRNLGTSKMHLMLRSLRLLVLDCKIFFMKLFGRVFCIHPMYLKPLIFSIDYYFKKKNYYSFFFWLNKISITLLVYDE
jgi:hypothetical protein